MYYSNGERIFYKPKNATTFRPVHPIEADNIAMDNGFVWEKDMVEAYKGKFFDLHGNGKVVENFSGSVSRLEFVD